MPLQDGTPRRPYDGPRDSQGNRPRTSASWAIILTIVFAVFGIAAVVSAMNGWNDDQTVTNAPANTPPSVQQPETTPAVNGEPAQK